MMKVHSSLLAKALENIDLGIQSQLLPWVRSKYVVHEKIVIDGPFTESKESCPHVAILAKRMREVGMTD